MARSHASMISSPPPMASPLTSATTGFVRSKRSVNPANPVSGNLSVSSFNLAFRSVPAQNDRSPDPVIVAIWSSLSPAKRLNALSSKK